MGQERPFEGRRSGLWLWPLPLRSGLCELGSSFLVSLAADPPWRRCFWFCVWQDGGDALLLALKFIGAVEAGALPLG